MGRRKNHQSNQSLSSQRDDDTIATDSEVLREFIKTPKPYVPVVAPKLHLPSFDLRKWHPGPVRTVSEPRSASRLVLRESAVRRSEVRPGPPERTAARALSPNIGFSQPKQVSVCVRRKTRREVLFAKNRTRKGSGARRTRSQWSDVKC